jgi:hypothetical protein
MVPPDLPRPGLAKARPPALVRSRTLSLVRASDARFRLAAEAADVVSEGRPEVEARGVVYYGSTSVLLAFEGGAPTPAELAALAVVAPLDPHLRVRALRIARREAAARAGGAIGSVHAELAIVVEPRGVRVTIDVAAEVAASRSGTHA